MSGLKIGVLTFHRCINYGSYWQARCLVEALQLLGHDAVILDHYSSSVNFAEWKCALHPVLPKDVSAVEKKLYRRKIEKFFLCFDELPLSNKFSLDDPAEMDNYNLVIVGSDEVWNLFHPWYGKKTLFYGDGINAQKIIAYAASFGNYPAIWGLDEEWSNRLSDFDMISVRDDNSFHLIKNAIGVEADIVLDPCLQFSISTNGKELSTPAKYLGVYGHNFSNHFIRKVRKFAQQQNLSIISIGYANNWTDVQWIDADPHEFVSFFSNASAIATNFFHGCVFSLVHQKPFVCETSPYRNNKLTGLMTLLKGEEHLMNEDSAFYSYHHHLTNKSDAKIFSQIEALRQSSNAYLNRALGMQQLQVA